MTHHQDIKPPTTLAEVLDVLNAYPDPDEKRQQAKVSAISRIATYMHRPPSDIPTNLPQLRDLLASLHPVSCGVKPKSLSTTKSDLASALRAAGVLPDHTSARELAAPWEDLISKVQSSHQVWGMMRFARFCSAHAIHPTSVGGETIQAFRIELEATLLTGDPGKHLIAMIDTWNHVVRKNGFDLPQLARPRSDRYVARPLTDYPKSLQDEVNTYIDRLARRDLFNDEGPDKPLRQTSLRNTIAHLRQILDALVASGRNPEDFTCLADLITADNLKAAFRAIMQRRNTKVFPTGFGNVAATFLAIARHHLQAPEQAVEALKHLHKTVATSPRGMSAKNSERLAQFNDWEAVVRLLSLPETLMARADNKPVLRKSAQLAMHAAALTILLSCPMRIKNLSGLDLDKHVIPFRTGTHTLYSIRIEGTEVKNGEPIEVKLTSGSSKLLHRYIMQFRPQISQASGRALFPRNTDGKPRTPDNFGRELTKCVYRETGLEVHPHLFRLSDVSTYRTDLEV
ncbi:tyrosine-type recombinase/integrase [Ruegeria marina]|uniref:Phage integrase family protein n=1 Tax=Ruegeria marina TaxID=639004 RepID=A0A1G7FYQ1_9RHOB|nr:tyrosine-type recombinase/integrase [Ruegeria marina]SDE80875.1 Phage integrase family protein [Ruegeria marina]